MDLLTQCAFGQLLRRCVLCASMLSTMAASQVAWAQMSGVISGLVVDSSGATVPDASVTMKNLETGAVRADTT